MGRAGLANCGSPPRAASEPTAPYALRRQCLNRSAAKQLGAWQARKLGRAFSTPWAPRAPAADGPQIARAAPSSSALHAPRAP